MRAAPTATDAIERIKVDVQSWYHGRIQASIKRTGNDLEVAIVLDFRYQRDRSANAGAVIVATAMTFVYDALGGTPSPDVVALKESVAVRVYDATATWRCAVLAGGGH